MIKIIADNIINLVKLLACLFLGLLLIISIDAREPGLFVFLLFAIVFTYFWRRSYKNKKAPSKKEMPNLNKTKEEHYKELGLTPQEIDFFRSTMNATKELIVQLQENMNTSTKLRAIDLRNDTIRLSKAMFKELVKEPRKLHLANHFLYTHLPNIVELTNKHIEIEQHEVKNKQTYEKLEESAQIIDQVSKLIAKDYEELVADDLDDLDIEISIAKNSLKRDNENNHSSEE